MAIAHDIQTFQQPIALRARQQAEQLAALHAPPDKQRQVYLNALAVQAVANYLRYFGFDCDWAASRLWQPSAQALADTAELTVRGWGTLECRPVLPGETSLRVPPETWGDRAGYVAVQFEPELRTATLLGFAPAARQLTLPLSALQPLTDLLAYLSQPLPVVRLRSWLQGALSQGWQELAALALPAAEPALNFRSSVLATAPRRECRAKVLQASGAREQVALVVSIAPAGAEFEISVALYPLPPASHLPADLQVEILDRAGETVMQAQARGAPAVSLELTGEAEEALSIRVQWGAWAIAESLTI